MPLSRRLPKRGFRNPFKKVYSVLNISQLKAFMPGTLVDMELLTARGLVKGRNQEVKLLARGDIAYALTIKVAAASEAARAKIETAGGEVIAEGA